MDLHSDAQFRAAGTTLLEIVAPVFGAAVQRIALDPIEQQRPSLAESGVLRDQFKRGE